MQVTHGKRGTSRPGMRGSYQVAISPTDTFPYTNCLAVHPSDFPQELAHVLIVENYPLTVRHDKDGKLRKGFVGVSLSQRQWIGIEIGAQVTVEVLPDPPDPDAPSLIQAIEIEVDFLKPGYESLEEYSLYDMAMAFVDVFKTIQMTKGQPIVFMYRKEKLKGSIKSMTLVDEPPPARENTGIIFTETKATFSKSTKSTMKTKRVRPILFAPNFKPENLGIGGLDTEFSDIFRRVFASRAFPPELVKKLGIQHVKGVILHGPPGAGKTLIARQIGGLLKAREPKIVNGPEILSKFVGSSEENIRNLFLDAEAEYKEKGDSSDLHIIIFDELDAICKKRGTNSGSHVGDNVVNQLLSKLDGVDQLNNILVMGMTNRIDMIDEAFLRPGRLEVHMEIALPDEQGRLQILNIHTKAMQNSGMMGDDVDLSGLARLTRNFSGAEITGLVKSATSFAFGRHIKIGSSANPDSIQGLRVNNQDFENALRDINPAFGVPTEELQNLVRNGIIDYDGIVNNVLKTGHRFVEQVRTSTQTPLVSILLHGPPGSGKTALAASIALKSDFPFIKLLSPDDMVGLSESQKVAAITKVFMDSYRSPLSVVVADDIERLIGWTAMNGTFSNAVLQTLLVFFKRCPPKDRRLLIIATSSLRSIFKDFTTSRAFSAELLVPQISSVSSLDIIMEEVDFLPSNPEGRKVFSKVITESENLFPIGIKSLLNIIEMVGQGKPSDFTEHLSSILACCTA